MTLAVFSDVHSNHAALEACFREAERRGADTWLFLGDYISDCAYPHKTMELLYEAQRAHACYFVKGNREEYVLSHHRKGSDWTYGTTTGSLLYTYENLTRDDLEFLDAMPNTVAVNPNGKCPIRLCHGAPAKTRQALRPHDYPVVRELLKLEEDILLGGHSHRQFAEEGFGKLYVNPGAVGVQTTGHIEADMAFLESDGNTYRPVLCHVPYDLEQTREEIRASGLLEKAPVWSRALLKQLTDGRNYTLFCMERAMELAGGAPPEQKHFEQAARDLGCLEEG